MATSGTLTLLSEWISRPWTCVHKIQNFSGVDWGFGPDATDEAEEKEIGFLESTTVDDSYYAEDPKKALNAFFVREGMDMEYDVEEIGQGYKKQFHCRIPLPVETPNGRQMVAEAVVHGKKKEALAAAILEACRILHAKGMLKGQYSFPIVLPCQQPQDVPKKRACSKVVARSICFFHTCVL